MAIKKKNKLAVIETINVEAVLTIRCPHCYKETKYEESSKKPKMSLNIKGIPVTTKPQNFEFQIVCKECFDKLKKTVIEQKLSLASLKKRRKNIDKEVKDVLDLQVRLKEEKIGLNTVQETITVIL